MRFPEKIDLIYRLQLIYGHCDDVSPNKDGTPIWVTSKRTSTFQDGDIVVAKRKCKNAAGKTGYCTLMGVIDGYDIYFTNETAYNRSLRAELTWRKVTITKDDCDYRESFLYYEERAKKLGLETESIAYKERLRNFTKAYTYYVPYPAMREEANRRNQPMTITVGLWEDLMNEIKSLKESMVTKEDTIEIIDESIKDNLQFMVTSDYYGVEDQSLYYKGISLRHVDW